MEDVNVPLLEQHNLCCLNLPLREGVLATSLVKASDGLVGGILTINIFCASYFLSWGNISSSVFLNDPIWKVIIMGTPFACFAITVWISAMAKAAEQSLTGLTTISWFVFVEFIWVLLLGAIMTCAMSGADPWKVGCVTAVLFLLMLTMWAMVFVPRKSLRSCCCCGRDVEAANAEDRDQEVVVSVFRASARRAQKLCAAHVKAECIAADAHEAANKIKAETAAAKERAEQADRVLQAAKEAVEEASSNEASAADVKARSQREFNWYKDQEEAALLEFEIDHQEAEEAVDKAATAATEASMRAGSATNAHEEARKSLEEAQKEAMLAGVALDVAAAASNDAIAKEQDANANAKKKKEEAAILKGEAELAASVASSTKQIMVM